MEKGLVSLQKAICVVYIILIILLLAEVFMDFHRFDNKTWGEKSFIFLKYMPIMVL